MQHYLEKETVSAIYEDLKKKYPNYDISRRISLMGKDVIEIFSYGQLVLRYTFHSNKGELMSILIDGQGADAKKIVAEAKLLKQIHGIPVLDVEFKEYLNFYTIEIQEQSYF